MMKVMILTTANGELYYESTGSGDAIVFIHGFSLDHRMWQPQVEHFSKSHQVITYDARGFGQSSPPNGPYSPATDLRDLLSYLKIERAHIVGLSMGGRIATDFAIAYPEMVESLALFDASLDGYASTVNWETHARRDGVESAKQVWLNHAVFAGTTDPKVISQLHEIVAYYSGWHWVNDDPELSKRVSSRERLSEIEVPALVAVGERDIAYFHDIADVLSAGISGSTKVIIEDAGHMTNLEASDTVNTLISRLINH